MSHFLAHSHPSLSTLVMACLEFGSLLFPSWAVTTVSQWMVSPQTRPINCCRLICLHHYFVYISPLKFFNASKVAFGVTSPSLLDLLKNGFLYQTQAFSRTRPGHFPVLDHCRPHTRMTALAIFFRMACARSSRSPEPCSQIPSCLVDSFPTVIS